ncbi:hypothetical protein [Moraxella ovis]|uniref:hypothetical protein n=1 Tax=Moraxella ovis TaxID=29433 RepID=UPI000D915B6E|nr:hypothetical protein [Moraxella ovis]SPX86851.1 Uncharacterised protein [Moraxella ovis]STZ05584.1 Uncharacterised protein [Moraxella ovis]
MKKPFVKKPIKPIHQRLKLCWWLWVVLAIIIYPLSIMMLTDVNVMNGVVVQILAMLPALLFTPAIMRGNSPYVLIFASIVTLVYLSVAGVLALIRYYEGVSAGIWGMRLVEFIVLLFINCYLFILLKRLPPMHK